VYGGRIIQNAPLPAAKLISGILCRQDHLFDKNWRSLNSIILEIIFEKHK